MLNSIQLAMPTRTLSKTIAYEPSERDEARLVALFIEHVLCGRSPWQPIRIVREFDYVSGRTDVLSLFTDNHVVAFEAKLYNWRRALHQAWRNTSFANRAYVVLPSRRGGVYARSRGEFEELGVGLCLVDSNSLTVPIESKAKEPLLGWLNDRARGALAADECRSRCRTCPESLQGAQVRLC